MNWTQLFEEFLGGLGVGAEEKRQALATYAAERADHLSLLVAEPGFEEAVKAEADNVALEAGILAAELGDEINRGIVAAIGGALGLVARALAKAA